jgi:hypothetical protein
MRNLILVAALALLVLTPLTAAAQPKGAPAAPPAVEHVSTNKILAIGVGALLGALAGQAIVTGEGLTLIGGAAGGLLAAWWYEVGSSGPTRAAMRAHTRMPALARAERLASTR